jgi:hypothetical protein
LFAFKPGFITILSPNFNNQGFDGTAVLKVIVGLFFIFVYDFGNKRPSKLDELMCRIASLEKIM